VHIGKIGMVKTKENLLQKSSIHNKNAYFQNKTLLKP
jgi:hypothetical protein